MSTHDEPTERGEGLDRGDADAHMTSDAPPAGTPTRLIWNPFLGTHLAQAPGRMRRRELTDECPFCADLTTGRVSPETLAWIRPNDFPPLQPPTGECYILIYRPEHGRSFADLTVPDVVRVVGLWREIYARLAPRYAAVMSWETCGEAIGQTQRHPHGQTFGLSVVPDTLARELAAIEHALAAEQGCPFCAEVERESGGARAVIEGEHWLAYVPEYARYPYQVHIVPRRHIPNIAGVEPAEPDGPATRELARMLLWVVRAYNRVYQAPMPYMLALHQLADERFHLHVELLPVGRAPGKLKLAASSESAWGFWVNDSLPEAKAAELRAAVAEIAATEAAAAEPEQRAEPGADPDEEAGR
jgi:UDPglucose--hexose-1-phosphate uridylyltransferase